MSTTPISLKYLEEQEYFKITQEGMPGVSFPEFYLGKVLRAIKDETYQNQCYQGKIGVSSTPRSVILYSYKGADRVDGVVMTKDQAHRFLQAVTERYKALISLYAV